jgi:hypothetical protein
MIKEDAHDPHRRGILPIVAVKPLALAMGRFSGADMKTTVTMDISEYTAIQNELNELRYAQKSGDQITIIERAGRNLGSRHTRDEYAEVPRISYRGKDIVIDDLVALNTRLQQQYDDILVNDNAQAKRLLKRNIWARIKNIGA